MMDINNAVIRANMPKCECAPISRLAELQLLGGAWRVENDPDLKEELRKAANMRKGGAPVGRGVDSKEVGRLVDAALAAGKKPGAAYEDVGKQLNRSWSTIRDIYSEETKGKFNLPTNAELSGG
jgi:hypothetical protein